MADVIKLGPKMAVNNEKHDGNGSGGQVNEDLVMELSKLLEMAQRGQIAAAAITAVDRNGEVGNVVVGTEDTTHQLISGSVLATQFIMGVALDRHPSGFRSG
jgi:hypothetical protein